MVMKATRMNQQGGEDGFWLAAIVSRMEACRRWELLSPMAKGRSKIGNPFDERFALDALHARFERSQRDGAAMPLGGVVLTHTTVRGKSLVFRRRLPVAVNGVDRPANLREFRNGQSCAYPAGGDVGFSRESVGRGG